MSDETTAASRDFIRQMHGAGNFKLVNDHGIIKLSFPKPNLDAATRRAIVDHCMFLGGRDYRTIEAGLENAAELKLNPFRSFSAHEFTDSFVANGIEASENILELRRAEKAQAPGHPRH